MLYELRNFLGQTCMQALGHRVTPDTLQKPVEKTSARHILSHRASRKSTDAALLLMTVPRTLQNIGYSHYCPKLLKLRLSRSPCPLPDRRSLCATMVSGYVRLGRAACIRRSKSSTTRRTASGSTPTTAAAASTMIARSRGSGDEGSYIRIASPGKRGSAAFGVFGSGALACVVGSSAARS